MHDEFLHVSAKSNNPISWRRRRAENKRLESEALESDNNAPKQSTVACVEENTGLIVNFSKGRALRAALITSL